MTLVLLVRHGQNNWVKKQRLAGWLPDIHLNKKGHRQARKLSRRLAEWPLKSVYSSPLTRCLETATYIAESHNLPVVELAAWGEVRYGDWEGKKIKKLAKKPLWHTVQHFPGRMRFPGGESLAEVQHRATQALEQLAAKHEKESIVIVSHADVIRLVLAHYLGLHIDLFQRLAIAPASVSVLALPAAGGVRVLRLNDDGPLRPPPENEQKKSKEQKPKAGQKERTAAPDGADV